MDLCFLKKAGRLYYSNYIVLYCIVEVYYILAKPCYYFCRNFQSGLIVPNVYQLEKMQSEVASLCHRISQLPSATVTDK